MTKNVQVQSIRFSQTKYQSQLQLLGMRDEKAYKLNLNLQVRLKTIKKKQHLYTVQPVIQRTLFAGEVQELLQKEKEKTKQGKGKRKAPMCRTCGKPRKGHPKGRCESDANE